MCLKLFWSKNSSRDGGRDFSPPKKNKVFNKPPSRDRDDIEKETSTNNSKLPRPLVSEETYYPTSGGGGGGYVDEDSKSDAAYEVSESTTLKGVHGVFG
ncbi:hypothetical protein QJS04_geneDACA003094 [Acorus gramineus]|uniref:Uncharacterized protein n=1 Tax=Acorus gramineus TaxID=55184 RepID=A0AAV9BUE1_ACOGR|nr:hypothetical protein QJS04_geneDACA003094 [Acorus gramineus]